MNKGDNRERLETDLTLYRMLIENETDTNKRFKVKLECLKQLSGELYGNIITYNEAKELLK